MHDACRSQTIKILDTFSGSGTTGASAIRLGREYIGVDIRQSQCQLTRRRLDGVQREIFA
jgi:DNA modification methylase